MANVDVVPDQPDAQSDDENDNEIEIDGDGDSSLRVPISSPGEKNRLKATGTGHGSGGHLGHVASRAQSSFWPNGSLSYQKRSFILRQF